MLSVLIPHKQINNKPDTLHAQLNARSILASATCVSSSFQAALPSNYCLSFSSVYVCECAHDSFYTKLYTIVILTAEGSTYSGGDAGGETKHPHTANSTQQTQD